MDSDEFQKFGSAMMHFVSNYLDNIRERKVLPEVGPGYLKGLIPTQAPEEGEDWKDLMVDLERVIMPGLTHWHSPRFHAYFPTANSYPAIVADVLSSGLACIGFSWIGSPACTELEMVMMDWLGKLLGLPQKFLFEGSGGIGGGVIQGSASEATLVAVLSARSKMIRKVKEVQAPNFDESSIMSKLVAYSSDQSHCSVERAGLLAGVRFRLLESDSDCRLRGETLQLAMEEDKVKGLIPFFVVATLGTTGSCAFDPLDEIGQICEVEDIWLHVDAAYAGSAFICEEYRDYMKGIERTNSFNFNPHKWLLVNFDCSAMWVANSNDLVDAFNMDAIILKHDAEGKVPDYRHWQIPLGRRFRSLKLWFVLRIYGRKKLQEHIRTQIALAHKFEGLLLKDERFEIMSPVIMGLVCFRLRGRSDEINERLLKQINQRGNIYMVPAKIKGQFIIRFVVCSRFTVLEDIEYSWREIQNVMSGLNMDEE